MMLRAEPGTRRCHSPFSWGLNRSASPCSAHVLSRRSRSGQGDLFRGFCLQWFTALASQSDRCGFGAGLHRLLPQAGCRSSLPCVHISKTVMVRDACSAGHGKHSALVFDCHYNKHNALALLMLCDILPVYPIR